MPHLGQNPSVRPGCPPRDRPTGAPQLGQIRLSSGTCGFFMIACEASITGAGGTRVRPAPSRAERSRCEPDCTRRVILLPLTARREPRAVESSRLDPWVRVETPPPPSVSGVAGGGANAAAAEVGAGAAATGAPAGLPQTSQ